MAMFDAGMGGVEIKRTPRAKEEVVEEGPACAEEEPYHMPPMPPKHRARLSRDECLSIVKTFSTWDANERGSTDQADAVFAARRDLLIKVYNRLKDLV